MSANNKPPQSNNASNKQKISKALDHLGQDYSAILKNLSPQDRKGLQAYADQAFDNADELRLDPYVIFEVDDRKD